MPTDHERYEAIGRALTELFPTRWEFSNLVDRIGDLGPGPVVPPDEPDTPDEPIPGDVWIRTYSPAHEDDDRDIEGEQSTRDHSIQFVTAPGYPERTAAQFLLLPGDPVHPKAGGYRAEFHGSNHVNAGSEWWESAALFVPEDFDPGPRSGGFNDRIIFQHADAGSPHWSQHLSSDGLLFWRQCREAFGPSKFDYHGDRVPILGKWANVVEHVRWSKGSDGVFESWVNGSKVVDYRGRTLDDRDVAYTKWGIYGKPTRLFYGELRRAEGPDRYDDVLTQW